MRQRGAKWPARRGVPEAGRVVAAAGQDGLAVGAEGDRLDASLVRQRLADRPAVGHTE
jgi:hypothetical protein